MAATALYSAGEADWRGNKDHTRKETNMGAYQLRRRMTVCLCLLACSPAFGQSKVSPQGSTPDPDLYEFLFRGLAQIKDPRNLYFLDAIALTQKEAESLHALALDCVTEIGLIDKASKPLTFEARVRSIDSNGKDLRPAKRFKELQDKRRQAILDHIQRLKALLGESRFETLDAFVSRR